MHLVRGFPYRAAVIVMTGCEERARFVGKAPRPVITGVCEEPVRSVG